MLRAPGPYVASSPRPSRSFRSRWSQQPLGTGQRWSPSSTPCSPSETSTAATDPYFGGVELVDQLDRSTFTTWRERVHRPGIEDAIPGALLRAVVVVSLRAGGPGHPA